MNKFLQGSVFFFDGISLLFKPGIKRFVLIPLCINILVFIGFFFLFKHFFNQFNTWFYHLLPSWLHWLTALLWVFFVISFFIFFVYFFVTIANLISAPFNSFLSEKIEFYLTEKTSESRTLLDNLKDIPRILKRQLQILLFYIPRAMVILILFFVPIVQVFAALIWFLFNAWNSTFTYTDYPTDNHKVPINQLRNWLWERPYLTLGFGLTVLIFSMIPVLNFIAVPASVAGATKLWIKEEKKLSS